MRVLSATEAISPAIERTQDLLARPFRFATFLKIAAVAFFAEMSGGFNFNLPSHSNGLHGLSPALIAPFMAIAVVIGLIVLVIELILFYIGSRLQLVLIELVATRYPLVGPLWRKYGVRTWRWIGLKLLAFLVVLILALPIAIPIVLYFIHHGMNFFSGNSPFFGLHIAQILLLIAAILIVAMVLGALYMLVRDLALPYLALEDLSISQSLERLRALIAAEPGQVILFVILRIILGFVFGVVAYIAIVLILLLSLIPPGIIGVILWFALHNAGTAGTVALIGCAVVGAIVYLCWAVCVVIGFMGSVLTFTQAYALYFLGGRYPLLGELLERSTPQPAYAYATAFPPTPTQPPPQSEPPQAEPPSSQP